MGWYKRVRSATPTGAALPLPHNHPVTVGTTNPPPPSTSCKPERRVPEPFDTHPKEGEGKEGVGSREKEGKEEIRGGEGRGSRQVDTRHRHQRWHPNRCLPPPNTLAGTPHMCQTRF